MLTPQIEILSLWSNALLEQRLEEHASHTERLTHIAQTQAADSIFTTDDASVSWLKANLIHGIGAMLDNETFDAAPDIEVEARIDVYNTESYASLINRPGAYLSGLYVLRAPRDEPTLGERVDNCPGCITFYDPRVGMNMNAIRLDPYVNYHYTVEFVSGLLLIWPSYVSYYVHPHLAASPALHVSFDVQASRQLTTAGGQG
jgi:hypothetical protein